MESTAKRNELILKIEYHRQMAQALEDDITSKSHHILSAEEHEKVLRTTEQETLREALRQAAKWHSEKAKEYERLFQRDYPEEDLEALYLAREHWMIDEIWEKKALLEDPTLQSREDDDWSVRKEGPDKE